MIDFDILKEFGCTKERMRKVFTSNSSHDEDEDGDELPENEKLYKWRQKWETRIDSDIKEGLAFNFRQYYIYASADLAWDGNIITKEVVPHMLYAQGKITFEGWRDRLKKCGCTNDEIEKFCGTEDKDNEGKFKEDGVGPLIEMPVNLVRSLVQRRAAAQINKFVSAYPFLKYDTYSRSYEAQLRSEAMSQRAEIMTNQYDYRKQMEQTIRDALLYPHFIEFPAGSWHKEKQYRRKQDGSGTESYIVREGVQFVRPHPSRVSWDISQPLSGINTDNGPEHIFYWDVVKWCDIKGNPQYFNRDNVVYSDDFNKTLNGQYPYWQIYYATDDNKCRMEFPLTGQDVAGENDREKNIGIYGSEWEDQPVVLTEYRRKIIPKDWGLGDYPYEVWVRLIVAGERTVIYGEFLPSLPACYYGLNENDNRLFNISFAHEVMPWQDQATRLQMQILATMNQSLLKVLLINTGVMQQEQVKELGRILKSGRYMSKPIEVEVNMDDANDVQRNLEAIRLVEAKQDQDINTMTRALIQLVSLAERTLNFSPQEQGQPAPREISATEVLEIANTTNTVYELISKGIEFGLGAKKRIIYDATVSLSEGEMVLPITQRFPEEVIKKAGFRLLEDDDEFIAESAEQNPGQQVVIGTREKLVYSYIFNNREGSQRISDAKTIQTLTVLVQLLLTPQIMEMVGGPKIIEVVSAIFRAAGVPIDVKLDPEGQQKASGMMSSSQQMQQSLGEVAKALAQVAQGTTVNSDQISQIEQVVQGLIGQIARLETGQSTARGPVQPVSTFDADRLSPELPERTMPNPQPIGARTADPFEV